MNNLPKLAEQQKNQRALKIKNRIIKQTHDIELAESLSTKTKKLDGVRDTTEKVVDLLKESQPETPHLAIEKTPNHQPIESIERVIYDVELENTLKNMSAKTGFFKTFIDRDRGWMWNGYPNKMKAGTEVEINDKEIDITPGFQKVSTDTSNIPLRKLNDKDRETLINILESLSFEK